MSKPPENDFANLYDWLVTREGIYLDTGYGDDGKELEVVRWLIREYQEGRLVHAAG